jgi:hypothetical protein
LHVDVTAANSCRWQNSSLPLLFCSSLSHRFYSKALGGLERFDVEDHFANRYFVDLFLLTRLENSGKDAAVKDYRTSTNQWPPEAAAAAAT